MNNDLVLACKLTAVSPLNQDYVIKVFFILFYCSYKFEQMFMVLSNLKYSKNSFTYCHEIYLKLKVHYVVLREKI